jgi:hypothetical protein
MARPYGIVKLIKMDFQALYFSALRTDWDWSLLSQVTKR